VWRTKGSSALVMTLVLLPVAGLAGGAIFWQSHVPTPDQAASLELGQNSSWIQAVGGPDPTRWQAVDNPWDNGVETDDAGRAVNPEGPRPVDPPPHIPEGSTVREIVEWGGVYVETAQGVGNVSVSTGDVWGDAFRGRYVIVSGTPPSKSDEAMVSPGLLERLGIEVGEDVVLIDAGRAFAITGTLRRADAVPESEELFLPAHADGLIDGGQVRWFVEDWQPDQAQLAELNADGYVAYARDLAVSPPPGARLSSWMTHDSQNTSMIMTGLMIAVFSGYLVVLLAGAAFAVSARRQQQSLAVAASVGASRPDIFRIVVMQGTVLGASAGAIGIALGAGLAWAVLEATDTGAVNTFWGNWGYRAPWVLLAAIAVFAVLVGTLAAAAPARAATRGDVLGALRGSRRPTVLRRRRPWWGLGLMITGLLATAVGGVAFVVSDAAGAIDSAVPVRVIALGAVALGPIVFQIGFLLAGHWVLVFVGRPLARLGIAPRLASRDSSANPSRVVPAFAAIAACVFLASYAISTTALTSAQNERMYWHNGPLGSVTASVYETGEPTGEALATAEDILAPTSPRASAVVLAPTSTAYDLETGLPEDLAHPVWAVAGQSREQCEPCGDPSMAMNGQLSIVDADDVSLLLDHPVAASVLAAYRHGAAIATTEDYVSSDGEVVITRWTEQSR
ncbi:MAG: FtsX-like permease family protein, partial [Microbacterium sp.]